MNINKKIKNFRVTFFFLQTPYSCYLSAAITVSILIFNICINFIIIFKNFFIYQKIRSNFSYSNIQIKKNSAFWIKYATIEIAFLSVKFENNEKKDIENKQFFYWIKKIMFFFIILFYIFFFMQVFRFIFHFNLQKSWVWVADNIETIKPTANI